MKQLSLNLFDLTLHYVFAGLEIVWTYGWPLLLLGAVVMGVKRIRRA